MPGPDGKVKGRAYERELSRASFAFLYGDLGLGAKLIADLLGTTKAHVQRVANERGLRQRSRVFGELTDGTFVEFVALYSAESKATSFPKLPLGRPRWGVMRAFIQRDIRKCLDHENTWTYRLEWYLSRLPYKLEAARARLTQSRLELLWGEFALSECQIAHLLDTTFGMAVKAIAESGLSKGESYLRLYRDNYQGLAQALGRDEWEDRTGLRDSTERRYRNRFLAARDGFLKEAESLGFDWSAVDRFIATAKERRDAKKAAA